MTTVARSVRTAGLFALHHTTVFAGILLFPFALAGRRAGVTLPLGSVVTRIHDAYDAAVDAEDAAEADE